MDNELSINDIFGCLKRNWWKILIFAVLAALLMGAYTHFFIPKKYVSSVEFYIINTNDADYAQTALLSAAAQLSSDYIELIRGDEIMNAVSAKLKETGVADLSAASLRKRISAKTADESSLFTLSITDTDPQRAYDIACVIVEIAPDMLKDITKPGEKTASVPLSTSLNAISDQLEKEDPEFAKMLADKATELKETNNTATVTAVLDRKDAVMVNQQPKVAVDHSSPNLLGNCVIAAIAGAVLSAAYFILRSLINTMVRTEDDVKRAFKYPLIGTIPSWDFNDKSSYAKTDYRKNK